jgi:predicted CXXCH cytochrome family protein
MNGRRLLAALAAAAPALALALDSPHNASNPLGAAVDCDSCHIGHSSPGGALTTHSGNFNLCQSCHAGANFGFSGWTSAVEAVPGVSGTSHTWSALVTDGGTSAPAAGSEMGKRVPGGKLMCSTCHDQHNASGFKGRQHVSVAIGTALVKTVGDAAATLTLQQPGGDAAPSGFCVRVGPTATQFQLSRDKCASWYGWNGSDWQAGVAAGRAFTPGTPIALDGAAGKVTATFSGTFAVGDRWQPFYLSYPFLRVDSTASAMCLACHPDRNMSHVRARGDDPSYPADGVNVFSHPVGEALDANGGGYDRPTPLDATGAVQSAASNAADPAKDSNDIELAAGDVVHCLSCHRPHNADSNSLTLDPH